MFYLRMFNKFHKLATRKSLYKSEVILGCFYRTNNTSTTGRDDVCKKSIKIAEKLVATAPKSWRPFMQLARLDKPIGTWLLYWPCGWGIASAAAPGCFPDLYLLALFGAGSVVMRGAGCTINDMWDRKIDMKVERTRNRPLVSGEVTMRQAWLFLGAQLTVGLVILLRLNWYSVFLGASSLLLVTTYPLMKRYTYWPQFILGLAFNWGALLGYSAVQGSMNLAVCVPLYIAGVCWTIFYDTIYAYQDLKDDLRVGIKSTAIKFKDNTKLWLSGFGGTMVGNLMISGYMNEQSWPYYAAVALLSTHLASQLYTLDINNASDCAEKFISNAHVGFILFLGIVLGTLFNKKKQRTAQIQTSNLL